MSHQAQPLGGRKPGAEEWAPSEAMRIIAAAALYFLIVYCVGFLLGALRVFWLEPRLGETVAVLCEAPFVLIASVLAARWLPTILSLRITTASLLAMGIGALCLQQLADFALGALLRGITPTQQIAHFATAPGMVYFTLLVVFAAMPILANWPSLPSRRSTLT